MRASESIPILSSSAITRTLPLFAPQWIAGLRVQIDRSHDYAPNRAVAYLRYFFDRQKGQVALSPTPVRPYSAY